MRRTQSARDDARYLELRRAGKTYESIALACGVSIGEAWNGVRRARERQREAAQLVPRQAIPIREPNLIPMFPLTSFTRESSCPHHGPIARGSDFVCMVCHQSGRDGHPALVKPPLLKIAAGTADAKPKDKRTRKERRVVLSGKGA